MYTFKWAVYIELYPICLDPCDVKWPINHTAHPVMADYLANFVPFDFLSFKLNKLINIQ